MASTEEPEAPAATVDTTPARPDVFVSYSRRDQAFVQDTLWPALVAHGKDVWIDLEDIPPVADWRERVLAGASAANALIFVISPDSLQSQICAIELAHAVELNKRLIPVVRRDAGDVPVAPELERPNWIWLREQDDRERGMAALFEALDSDLEWRDAHSRLAVRTAEWLDSGGDRSFLLRGSDLSAAETWLASQGDHEQRATAEQTRYILASRQASSRRQRATLGAVAGALAITLLLAVFALVQRSQAIERERIASSRELAASALSVLPRDPELSVLLADRGVRTHATAEAQDALRRALADSHVAAVMRGHRGVIGSGVLDPAGRWVVTAGLDGTVRIWDAASGRQTALLRGHDSPLRGVAVSPDGARIVSAGEDGTARIFDRATGRVAAVMRGHSDWVHSPSYSGDGTRILTASLDGSARIWDARDGSSLAVLRHAGQVFSAIFDSRARRVVTASRDGTAAIWDARSGRRLTVLRGHPDWVNRAIFSPDGSLVATSSQDHTARLWSARTGDELHVLRGHGGPVSGLSFSADSRRLLTASNDATAAIWDTRSGRPLVELRGHADAVTRAIFSPDGRLVATTSADDSARLWDAASGELVASLRGHTDELGSPRFTADGRRFMTVSDDGTARIWHVPQRPRPIGGGPKPLEGAVLSPDGSRVFAWISATSGRLFDARTRRVVAPFGTSRYLVTGGSFLRDGRLLLTAAPGRGAAEIHDARDGRLVRRIDGPPSRVAAASRDGRRVVTLALGDKSVSIHDVAGAKRLATLAAKDSIGVALSPDGTVALTMSLEQVSAWDAASGRLVATLKHRAGFFPAASFRPDGRRAVITSLSGPVPVWDMRSDRAERFLRLRAQVPGQVLSVAWSPHGELVSVANRSDSGAVRTFDPASGREVAEMRGHRGEVRSASFSPDGRWLVTAGVDATARVWDARSGRQVAELLGHEQELVSAAFARDGRHVLTAAKDGTALLHDCAVCAPLRELRASIRDHVSAGRRLTAVERREYLHE